MEAKLTYVIFHLFLHFPKFSHYHYNNMVYNMLHQLKVMHISPNLTICLPLQHGEEGKMRKG